MTNKNDKKILRTLAIIDYANIKAWLREKELQIDLEMLKKALSEIGINDVRFYYGKDEKNNGIQKFFDVIEKFGYVLITKPVQYFRVKLSELISQRNNADMLNKLSKKLQLTFLTEIDNLKKENITLLQPKANFDVEIAVDMLGQIDNYDNFILFSGDSDFVPLVKKLQEQNKRVIAVSGRKMFSGLLRKQSDFSASMELLTEILSELVFVKMQKPVDKRQVFKKCTFSIATLNRLSSLFYKTGDK
ncbi:MAG: NYN domain-containing protein [Patescibacteria group bacterium]